MVFWNIVIGIAAFFLNLVLMPKPQNARPASLEDLNIPVVEEGLEIPVIFGTVHVKSPNCVWYGDFQIQPIKGSRRYGLFGPRQVTGYRYAIGMHFVLCHGVHDQISELWVGEKKIHIDQPGGVAEGSVVFLVYEPELWGGDDEEGGLWGWVHVLRGNPGQGANPYLIQKMGAAGDTPGFRGVVSIVLQNMYFGNNPYMKNWEFVLQRIHRTSRDAAQWYDAKAAILRKAANATADTPDYFDMNPAHIIRECLTDRTWGMGYAAADMDDVSFTSAADVLYAEGFGLSLEWNREEEIQEFVSIVLSHIDGYLYLRRTTGKFYLKLVRNDYVVGSLPVIGEDDVMMWDEVVRRQPAESISSVTVKYTDRDNRGKDASLTWDDIGQIQHLGRISTTRHYPGIGKANLASKVARRDQGSLSAGLINGRFTGTRSLDVLSPGDPFRLVSARHNLDGEIMRVVEMKFGDGRTNSIGVKFTQDVFNLSAAELVDDSEGDWESPVNPPAPSAPRLVWELPYRELVMMNGIPNANIMLTADPDAGMLGMGGARSSADALDAAIHVNGALEETMQFSPSGLLGVSIGAFDATVNVTDATDFDEVDVGEFAVIQTADQDPSTLEIVRIESVTGTTLTVTRGWFDTVPRAHSAGDWIVVYSDRHTSDYNVRTDGDAPSTEILTRTLESVLTSAAAPDDVVTFDSRAIRPLRPGNVTVEGQTNGPVDIVGNIDVTWANRNRTEPSVVWTAATQTPETGQTTVIDVYNPSNTTLLVSHNGLTGTSYTVPAASLGGNSTGWLHIGSERDGYREWQAFQVNVLLPGGVHAIFAPHHNSPDVFYVQAMAGGAAFVLLPPHHSSPDVIPTPVVIPGLRVLAPPLITVADAFFTPSIVGLRVLLPSLYSDADAYYAPTVVGPPSPHRYWRVLVTACGAGQNICAIGELEMYETVFGPNVIGASPTVLADGEYPGGLYAATNAFDQIYWDTGHSAWGSDNTALPHWIRVDFGAGNEKSINSIGMFARNDNFLTESSPTAFSVQYSDDATSWTTKWSHSGVTWTSLRELKRFNDPAASVPSYSGSPWGAHSYWRIVVGGASVIVLSEVEFRATVGGADQANGGTAAASSEFSGGTWVAANAFDNNNANQWANANGAGGGWLRYGFTSPVTVAQISVRARNEAANGFPTFIHVQFADSTSGPWTTAFQDYNETGWSQGETRTYTDPNYI